MIHRNEAQVKLKAILRQSWESKEKAEVTFFHCSNLWQYMQTFCKCSRANCGRFHSLSSSFIPLFRTTELAFIGTHLMTRASITHSSALRRFLFGIKDKVNKTSLQSSKLSCGLSFPHPLPHPTAASPHLLHHTQNSDHST